MEASQNFLVTERIGRLMKKYSVPCILSLLLAALYNIVDQLYIANASYLGAFGNAANNVVFLLTVAALAIATMIGDGCCTFVSICLGGNDSDAHRTMGSAVPSTLLSVVREILLGVGLPILLPVFWRLNGLLWFMPIADVITAVLSVWFVRKYDRKLKY